MYCRAQSRGGSATVSLALVALCILLAASAAADPCDYLIVTTDSLAEAFAPLAAHRADQGYRVEVVTMATVLAETPAEEDDPATLRSYLATRHAESGVRFVVLGGGADQVPVRLRYVNYGPGVGDRFYPTDLYFACHDGTWNADGDSLYGEAFDDGHFDVDPEVALGRIPARDAADVSVVVQKILAYEASQAEFKRRALLVAPVIDPHPWQPGDPVMFDGAFFMESVVPYLEALQPLALTRMYANYTAYPGSLLLTGDALVDSLQTGHFGLVDVFGRGSTTQIDAGDRPVGSDEFASLVNGPNAGVLTATNNDVAAFDLADNLMSLALWNPDGGICAGVGFTTLTYLTLSQLFHETFYQAAGEVDSYEIGEVWRTCLVDVAAVNPSSTAYLHLTAFVVLGDPAMPLWPAPATAVSGRVVDAAIVAVESCRPNPFNPRTSIAYSLVRAATVSVVVYDVRGRLVRHLERAVPRAAGRHTVDWNGRDDLGAAVASGSYCFRVTAGGESATGVMSLVQ